MECLHTVSELSPFLCKRNRNFQKATRLYGRNGRNHNRFHKRTLIPVIKEYPGSFVSS